MSQAVWKLVSAAPLLFGACPRSSSYAWLVLWTPFPARCPAVHQKRKGSVGNAFSSRPVLLAVFFEKGLAFALHARRY